MRPTPREFATSAAVPTWQVQPPNESLRHVNHHQFVQAMGAAVTGVNVVTTDGPAGRIGVTVSAVTSVSADPPILLACINRRSPVCASVRRNGVFCVKYFSGMPSQGTSGFAGRPQGGEPFDFGCARWSNGETGTPCLKDAVSISERAMHAVYDSGSHAIFIGNVVAVIEGQGNPLLYSNRTYGQPHLWS